MFENDKEKKLQEGEETSSDSQAEIRTPAYEYGQGGADDTSPAAQETTGENIPPYHPAESGINSSEDASDSEGGDRDVSAAGGSAPPPPVGYIPGAGAPYVSGTGQPPVENAAPGGWGQPPPSNGYHAPPYPGQNGTPAEGRRPVEYAPPMNGGSPSDGRIPPTPPQQTQWTFNDYGPLGGPGKPKKPKKAKTGKTPGSDGGNPSAGNFRETQKTGAGTGVKALAIVMSVLFVLSVAGFGGYIAYDMSRTGEPDTGSSASSKPSFHIQDSPEINNGQSGSSAPAITGDRMAPSDIYNAVEPAVVGVVGYVKARNGLYQIASQGSGVVFDANGYIVTNRHVIKDETTDQTFEKIEVIRTTGEAYTARVLGSDRETDLAVLKVEDTDLKTAVFGDSSQLRVGDQAFVIGNPSGMEYAGSLAGGYISAVNREVLMGSIGSRVELIQTDAAINPGNSGGALVNEYGQVVGITSAKLVGEEYEGMGFAIPINNVKPIVESLINNGYVTGRVQIGLTYEVISKTLSNLNGIPQGLRVVSLNEDSDALRKGIQPGDIIYAMDGKEVQSTPDVKDALNSKTPGESLLISVYRVDMLTGKAQHMEFEVTLLEKITKEE